MRALQKASALTFKGKKRVKTCWKLDTESPWQSSLEHVGGLVVQPFSLLSISMRKSKGTLVWYILYVMYSLRDIGCNKAAYFEMTFLLTFKDYWVDL